MEKLKAIDRKILAGLGLTVAFLILYLVTLPSVSYDDFFDPYAGLNETQKSAQSMSDIDYFNRAILFEDNTYCKNIMSSKMKKECLDRVTTTAQTPPTQNVTNEPQEEQNPGDIEKYNTAILFDDKKYCEEITNEKMKADCLSRWNQ